MNVFFPEQPEVIRYFFDKLTEESIELRVKPQENSQREKIRGFSIIYFSNFRILLELITREV